MFHDHFSGRAAAYAQFRPHYPDGLFDWLATVAPSRRLALDAATGNGQAAVPLSRRFGAVVATDASSEQLAYATPAPGLTYRRALAHESGLATAGTDLVTVAQALHWLDRDAFFAEARRVLKPGGVVAVWCYGVMEIGAGLDEAIRHFYYDIVGPYWPSERRITESGYRDIVLPFAELTVPAFAMTAAMTLEGLVGYVSTWSAVSRYHDACGASPLPQLRDMLEPHWGEPGASRVVRWPLGLRAGRA